MSSVPASKGSPTRPNSKNANGLAPASTAASLTMMFTGVPVRASSEPAWAENANGMSIWDGGAPTRVATTTTTRMSAATAPLTLISAVRSATRRQMVTINGVRLPAAAVDDLLADPRRHTGRVECLADDEEAGDEHDGRVPETGQRLTKIENAGEPEGYRHTDSDDSERHAVGDERYDGQRQDGERHHHGAHRRTLSRSGAAGNGDVLAGPVSLNG